MVWTKSQIWSNFKHSKVCSRRLPANYAIRNRSRQSMTRNIVGPLIESKIHPAHSMRIRKTWKMPLNKLRQAFLLGSKKLNHIMDRSGNNDTECEPRVGISKNQDARLNTLTFCKDAQKISEGEFPHSTGHNHWKDWNHCVPHVVSKEHVTLFRLLSSPDAIGG